MRASIGVITIMGLCVRAQGAVLETTSRAEWEAAAGVYSTIDFVGFADFTRITNQYAALGVTFTDGIDLSLTDPGFLNDGAGLYGAMDSITIELAEPIHSIAVDFPGGVSFDLYYNDDLIHASKPFSTGFLGNFAGIVSEQGFNSVVIYDVQSGVYIDDLHFGPPIPGPSAVALVVIATGFVGRGRRIRRVQCVDR